MADLAARVYHRNVVVVEPRGTLALSPHEQVEFALDPAQSSAWAYFQQFGAWTTFSHRPAVLIADVIVPGAFTQAARAKLAAHGLTAELERLAQHSPFMQPAQQPEFSSWETRFASVLVLADCHPSDLCL